jgi:SAM-dependent methyltransferase
VIYDALAPIYDRIMNHVDYYEWARLIERIIHKYIRVRNPSIFEIGGGTGALSSLLISRGFRYVGSDRSFSMCTIARHRNAPFVCADARAVPIKKKFDLICFLYDGINYLQTLEDYALLFSETAGCLSPGSYFLFDITTETNSLSHFKNHLDHEDWATMPMSGAAITTKKKPSSAMISPFTVRWPAIHRSMKKKPSATDRKFSALTLSRARCRPHSSPSRVCGTASHSSAATLIPKEYTFC